MQAVELEPFLREPGIVFDVRSPGEYAQGHIPEACSLPLFTDGERAEVGTLYKQTGREQAIELGLHFVGPKLSAFVAEAKKHLSKGFAKVHCWRGGMRSSSMAWLLNTAGLPVMTLKGGYKAHRRWVLETLNKPLSFHILGGLTGSGKSAILKSLKSKGEQILDLEQLAAHKGSSYGHLNMPPQPTYEQFENEIAHTLAHFDPHKPIWVEDESRLIGRCKIPDPLFQLMRAHPLFYIDCPFEERLERLYEDYGHTPLENLIEATNRLSKRLGGCRTQEAVQLIRHGKLKEAIALTLQYYDATYRHGLSQRKQNITKISESQVTPDEWADMLINNPVRIAHV